MTNHNLNTDEEPEFDQDYVSDQDIEEVEELDGQQEYDDQDDMEVDQEPTEPAEGAEFVFEDDSIQGFFDHKEPVFDVDINPVNPNIVVSGGCDDSAYLWDLSNGATIHQLTGHSDSVIAVGFSKDGKYVASGGMDGKIHVSLVETGSLVTSLEGPDEVTWLQWHPKGPVLLAGSADSSVWMYQLPSGNVMNVFSGHIASVTCGIFTPNGKNIVTGSDDGMLIVWDPVTAKALVRLTSEDARFHQESIVSLAVNPDSTLILSGSTDHSAKLTRLATGEIIGSFQNHTESVESVGFCESMPLAATGSVDGTINFWDINTFRIRHTSKHEDSVTKVLWLPQSPYLLSCSIDHTVCQWDARTGVCMKKWQGHQDSVLALAASSDGKKLVTGSDDGTCLVFGIE